MKYIIHYPESYIAENPSRHADLASLFTKIFMLIRQCGHKFESIPEPLEFNNTDPSAIKIGFHSKGIHPNTWHIKPSYLPKYYYFDRGGYSGWSCIADNEALFEISQRQPLDAAKKFVNHYRSTVLESNISKYKQSDKDFIKGDYEYIFLPLQDPSDTVIALSRFEYFDFIYQVINALKESPYHLVIKRHPGCNDNEVFRLLAGISKNSRIHITDCNVNSIIQQGKAVVCLNSGVGFESLFYYKPVITAAASDYEWITQNLHNSDDIMDLSSKVDKDVDEDSIAKFLYYFCTQYLINLDNENHLREKLLLIEESVGECKL